MISGFMVLKNALKTGYPFVESIAASLPVCDEFLISEVTLPMAPLRVVDKIQNKQESQGFQTGMAQYQKI
jgi:hypothetical protein